MKLTMTMTMTMTKVAAAALVLACAAGAHAQSSVTVYGLLDVGMEWSNGGSMSQVRMFSGGSMGSRLGFRGVEDLGGGLSAVFRLESGLNVDIGTLAQGGLAFGREATVGLASTTWGTVSLGRQPSPYNVSLPWVDAFIWEGAGGLLGLSKSGATTVQVIPLAVNGRPDNSVGWVSPNFNGVQVRALVALSEKSPTLGNIQGASARYTKGPIDVVAAYSRAKAGTAGTGELRAASVGGSYDFGPARAYLGYTREQNNCSNCVGGFARPAGFTGSHGADYRLINLGARFPFGAFTAIAQVVRIQDRGEYTVSPGSRDATWLSVGGDYFLSKRTTLYATVGSIANRNGSQYIPGAGSSQAVAGLVPLGNPRATVAGVGIKHTF
jgi:predicted porin